MSEGTYTGWRKVQLQQRAAETASKLRVQVVSSRSAIPSKAATVPCWSSPMALGGNSSPRPRTVSRICKRRVLRPWSSWAKGRGLVVPGGPAVKQGSPLDPPTFCRF